MTDPILSEKTSNGRYYTNPNNHKSVPSITNIKGMKHIEGLKYFYLKACGNYAADNKDKLATLDRNEVFQLVKGAPWAPKPVEDNPSKIGDIIHDFIDQDIKRTLAGSSGPEVDSTVYRDKDGNEFESPRIVRNMWRQYGGFVDRYKPKWVDSEFTVWSDTYGYAGTADWSAFIGNALVLGDTKTGKGVYPDTAIQLAALAKADYIIAPDGTQRDMPKFERFGILHVRPMFTRLVPVEHIDEWFEAFKALKVVFDTVINFENKTLCQAPKTEVRAS